MFNDGLIDGGSSSADVMILRSKFSMVARLRNIPGDRTQANLHRAQPRLILRRSPGHERSSVLIEGLREEAQCRSVMIAFGSFALDYFLRSWSYEVVGVVVRTKGPCWCLLTLR